MTINVSYSPSILLTISLVGVITRSISVAADAAVLFFTLQATWSIIKANSDIKAQITLTSTLVQNGNPIDWPVYLMTDVEYHLGSLQFGYG